MDEQPRENVRSDYGIFCMQGIKLLVGQECCDERSNSRCQACRDQPIKSGQPHEQHENNRCTQAQLDAKARNRLSRVSDQRVDKISEQHCDTYRQWRKQTGVTKPSAIIAEPATESPALQTADNLILLLLTWM